MEEIVFALLALIELVAIIRISLYGKWWQILVFASLSAIFVWYMYPVAIEQNNQLLKKLTGNTQLLHNVAAALILESLLLLGLVFFQLKAYYGSNDSKRPWQVKLMKLLVFYPGTFYFLDLFYLEVLFFLQPGAMDFDMLAGLLVALVFAGISFGAWLVRLLLGEEDLRLEITCFLLLLQLLLVVLLTAFNGVDGYKAPQGNAMNLEWKPFLVCLVLLMICALAGYIRFAQQVKKNFKE
jgi:hypothetical protein